VAFHDRRHVALDLAAGHAADAVGVIGVIGLGCVLETDDVAHRYRGARLKSG